MATVFIDNIDGNLLENFKAFAIQQGIDFSVFDRRENMTSIKTLDKQEEVAKQCQSIEETFGILTAKNGVSLEEMDEAVRLGGAGL